MQNSADYEAPPVEGIAGGGTGYGWNEASVKSTNSIGRVVDVTKQPTSDLLHVWCMPSTATISHQEPPRSLEQLHLLAARNERESAQLALRPKISWSGGGSAGHVKLQFTNLKSSSGAELLEVGKSVTARHVMPILGVPDALVPLKMPIANISLLPGETCGIWLSVDVPSSQPPGLYEGEICITAVKGNAEDEIRSPTEADRREVRKDIQALISNTSITNESLTQEVADGLRSIHCGLEKLLRHPSLSMSHEENGKMDIDGDSDTELAIRVKINVTVWDFVLPLTPSLPSVFGISETVIEDRFGVEHGSNAWYSALDMHYKWLLQYRISPYFCRWGDSMRVLTYTCPWPADHPKAEEYYSDPRLAAYAVPYAPVLTSTSTGEDVARKELEILKTKSHWKKAYFYLWDEPLSLEQYETIRTMAEKIRSVASDARVLTTYYCGPSNASVPPGSFEAFVKVPTFLRPHTQIYCTSEWVLGGHEELIKDILRELQPENNEEWWTYVCMGPSDPHPNWHLGMRGTQHRAVMWRVWKEGGTGFLYWGANCYEKALAPAAEIRFRRGLPPGDGVLFYPGEVFDPEATEPVASARLERILSGLQDYEYLNLYASRYGRGAALGLLEKCGLYFGPENYAHDHMPIDAFRSEVYHSCRIT